MAVAGKWTEGRVVGQTRWTERLYSLQVAANGPAFQAGQFAKLALEIDGEMVARPYSSSMRRARSRMSFITSRCPAGR